MPYTFTEGDPSEWDGRPWLPPMAPTTPPPGTAVAICVLAKSELGGYSGTEYTETYQVMGWTMKGEPVVLDHGALRRVSTVATEYERPVLVEYHWEMP